MSEFLFIVPQGWTEFQEINTQINDGAISISELNMQLSESAWEYVDNMLAGAGIVTDGKLAKNAKLIFTDTGYRFWVVLE